MCIRDSSKAIFAFTEQVWLDAAKNSDLVTFSEKRTPRIRPERGQNSAAIRLIELNTNTLDITGFDTIPTPMLTGSENFIITKPNKKNAYILSKNSLKEISFR